MFIPRVFQRDAQGHAIPELVPGMEWIIECEHSVLQTVKLDGIAVKVGYQMNGWTLRREVGPDEWKIIDRSSLDPLEKLLIEAANNTTKEGEGIYIAIGPGIKNNPQKLITPRIFKVLPVANCLIMYGEASGIRRRAGVKVLFDTCRMALIEGDAEGVVFQWEETMYKLKAWGQVTRKDFDLAWPLPETTVLTPSQALLL